MVLQEKNKNKNNIYIYKKNTNTKRHLFIPLYLGINYIDYSLKLSKECLMTPKVVLPKPNLKNHPHQNYICSKNSKQHAINSTYKTLIWRIKTTQSPSRQPSVFNQLHTCIQQLCLSIERFIDILPNNLRLVMFYIMMFLLGFLSMASSTLV